MDKKRNITNSATKIVLLALVMALIALTFIRIVSAEQFMNIVVAVVSFYFGKNQSTPSENTNA